MRRISHSDALRLGIVIKPRVTMEEKLNVVMMAVAQSKRCHESDETASVRRVWCRVAIAASLKHVVDRASCHDAEAMAGTSACV